MNAIVINIISAFLLIGFTAFLIHFSKEKFGYCLTLSCLLIPFVMLIGQFILSTFSIPYYLLVGVSMCGFFYILKDRKDFNFRNNFFSIGFFVFIAILMIYFVIDFNRHFRYMDEFSHWGIMIKEMLRLDSFYSVGLSNSIQKDYPPFCQLFELYWCKLGYSEMTVSIALHICQLAFVACPVAELVLKKDQKHNLLKSLAFCFAIIMYISGFDVYDNIARTIYLDIFVSVVFVYVMLIIWEGKYLTSYFWLLCLTLGFCALSMVKKNSFVMTLLASFFLLIKTILLLSKPSSPHLSRKGLFVLIPVIFSLIMWIIWRKYTAGIGAVGEYDFSDITKRFGDIEYIKTRVKLFEHALFEDKLFAGIIPICYINSFPIAMLLSYVAYKFDENKNIKNYVALIASFGVGTIGYAAMMLVLYATMIGADSTSELSNYARYMSTYIISEFLFIGFLIVVNLFHKHENAITLKNILIVIGIMFMIIDPKQLSVFMPSILTTRIEDPYIEMCNVINDNTKENDSVYLIGDDVFDYFAIVQYLSNGVSIQATYDQSIDFDDVMRCDYVWVMEDNNLDKADFERITGISNPKPNVLYRISQ